MIVHAPAEHDTTCRFRDPDRHAALDPERCTRCSALTKFRNMIHQRARRHDS